MKEFLYFDKNIDNPDNLNRTLMFGEGVFETFRYKQSLPVYIERHMARLKKSSEFLGIKFPGDFYIETTVENIVKNHNSKHFNNVIKDLTVKVALFSSGGSSYSDLSQDTVLCVSIKEDDGQIKNDISLSLGESLVSSFDIYNSHKTTNYLLSSKEKKISEKKGFDDALLINEKGVVVETTSGNFFWIKGSNVFTPSIETGALNGITRSIILEICKEAKVRVVEGEFEPGAIIFPEAMFITNSVRGIVEVIKLNNTTKPTKTKKIFPIIKNKLWEYLKWL